MPGDRLGPWPPPSLETIYRQQWRYVWKSARRMGISDDRLDDVVQDVFIVVGKSLEAFERRSSLRTWLYSITFRVVQEHHRRCAREQRPDVRVAAPRATPEQALEQLEAARTLHSLLAELPESQRLVVSLTELEGMAAPEIADELGIKLNTVYSRLRLGRKRLEQAAARRRARAPRQPDGWARSEAGVTR